MEIFLKEAARSIVRFRRLARAGRWADLAKEAHRLKGAALTLRLGGLAETLAGLEKAAQGGRELAVASQAERIAAEFGALRRFWSGRKRI
jgi:HPt (histidine-containing phosphotransfer) domain-containing protein